MAEKDITPKKPGAKENPEDKAITRVTQRKVARKVQRKVARRNVKRV